MTTFKRSDEMMGCLITKYGEVAEFDGQKVRVWPLPKVIAQTQCSGTGEGLQPRLQGEVRSKFGKKA